MAQAWMMLFWGLLCEAWSARRDARTQFLKLQIELLRQKLPGNRVILSPEERSRMLKMGEAVGHEVNDLIGIVSVKTYKRWLREQRGGEEPGRVGRPRKMTASVRELILRLARENTGWGVRRIVGELRKLALTPSRSSVRRVLVHEGLLPDPDKRVPEGVTTPWRTFVKMHIDTMVASDFFCKNIWTPFGKRVAYSLMFIHLGSRKVFVSPSTYHPTQSWMNQQARNVAMWLEDEGQGITHLIHDRDTKFAESFDGLYRSAEVEVIKTPFASPVANCYAASWIGSMKRECLNHFFCVGPGQLDHIVQTYVGYYNTVRPHQGKGNEPLANPREPPDHPPSAGPIGPIRRHDLLGGLLNHYERKAA